MCNSVIYATNTATQPVIATGSIVNFGNIIRRYGKCLNLSGGNVETYDVGYYDVDVNLTVLGTGAGTMVIQVYKDGVAIPGAEASVTTVADASSSVSIDCIIRDNCPCESTITVVASGVAGSISNASIVVEKV